MCFFGSRLSMLCGKGKSNILYLLINILCVCQVKTVYIVFSGKKSVSELQEALKGLVQLAFKLKTNKGNRNSFLNRFQRSADPLFLLQKRLDHIFCKGNKILIDGMSGRTRPVVFQSQKEKKEAIKQVDITKLVHLKSRCQVANWVG